MYLEWLFTLKCSGTIMPLYNVDIHVLSCWWFFLNVGSDHNHGMVDPGFGVGGSAGIPVPIDPGFGVNTGGKGSVLNDGQGKRLTILRLSVILQMTVQPFSKAYSQIHCKLHCFGLC